MKLSQLSKVLALTGVAALTASAHAGSVVVGALYASNGVINNLMPLGTGTISLGTATVPAGAKACDKEYGSWCISASATGTFDYINTWNRQVTANLTAKKYAIDVTNTDVLVGVQLGRSAWQSAFGFDVAPSRSVNLGDAATGSGYTLALEDETDVDHAAGGKGIAPHYNTVAAATGVSTPATTSVNTIGNYLPKVGGVGVSGTGYSVENIYVHAGPYAGSEDGKGFSAGLRYGIIGPSNIRPNELHAEYHDTVGDADVLVGVSYDHNLWTPGATNAVKGSDLLYAVSGKFAGFGATLTSGRVKNPGADKDNTVNFMKVAYESSDLLALGSSEFGLGMTTTKKLMTGATDSTKVRSYRIAFTQDLADYDLTTQFYYQRSSVKGPIASNYMSKADATAAAATTTAVYDTSNNYKPLSMFVFKLGFNW